MEYYVQNVQIMFHGYILTFLDCTTSQNSETSLLQSNSQQQIPDSAITALGCSFLYLVE